MNVVPLATHTINLSKCDKDLSCKINRATSTCNKKASQKTSTTECFKEHVSPTEVGQRSLIDALKDNREVMPICQLAYAGKEEVPEASQYQDSRKKN